MSPIFKAALWMAGWLACMVVMTVAGRETTHELDIFQVMLMRSVIGLVLLGPLIYQNGGLRTMRTSRPLRHLARNIAHYGAQFSWLMALNLIPLAQVVSIEFTMPLWTAIMAAAFLGERVGFWKALAVALGLIGVAIIVRPFSGAISPGQLIALCAALGFAISVVLIKTLTRTDKAVVIIFWMMTIQSMIGLVPGLMVWRWPSAHVWPWIFVIAFVGTYSHYCMARAMMHADATVVVPMDFLRVPLTALTGWLVYSEKIDIYVAAGAVLILTGNLLNLKAAKR
jgi:drug/metabolite transporter (DMT)-like permease